MTLETETVLDRRRLRRKLGFWRSLAVVALVLGLGAALIDDNSFSTLSGRQHVARVSIEGTITENREQLKLLKKVAESKQAAALILFVNSPGGTTAGGEALFEALREVAKTKPVVAQFGTVAASAGYIVGLATDHIVARGNTITGSVGVLVQWPELSELLGKIGVKMNEIKSGDLKAIPSPFKPLDDRGRKITEEMIQESNRWFQSLVESRRGIKIADVPGLADGRIYSGREALTHKLVDAIGGEKEAQKWLEETRNIQKDLKIVDWKPSSTQSLGWGFAMGEAVRGALGLGADGFAGLLRGDKSLSMLGLDGLVSVWHPSEN